jgi:hypothetical protein
LALSVPRWLGGWVENDIRVMSEIENVINGLAKLADVSDVSGGPVPMPDENGDMKQHIFINLKYSRDIAGVPDAVLVENCRKITCAVFEMAKASEGIHMFESICVTFFPSLKAKRRLYRTRMNTDLLDQFTRESLNSLVVGEENQLPSIREILSNEE